MFWQNFKYNLKLILRDRSLIFWTLAFPLIMALLFNLAFSNIENSEKFEPMAIAVVENAEWQKQEIFQKAFAALSAEGEEQLFHTEYLSETGAATALENEEITAYLEFQNGQPKITARENGINTTILKTVVERIGEQSQVVQEILRKNPAQLGELVRQEAPNLKDASRPHLSYTMVEYYTLIAMTCLYAGMISMTAVNRFLANMSLSGRRVAVSPTPKRWLILSGLSASYLVQVFGLALLFTFTIFGLKVDYGENFALVLLLSLVGCLAGTAFGVFVASSIRVSENAKTSLMIALSMFGCFLAGMMGITMKYVVDTNLPLLNQLNPANLITDGLYALYYYDVCGRYWSNIITLVIITLVIICISIWNLRKEQYDNL